MTENCRISLAIASENPRMCKYPVCNRAAIVLDNGPAHDISG